MPFAFLFFLVRFLSLAVAISLPLISVPNPCAVCCNQHNNQHNRKHIIISILAIDASCTIYGTLSGAFCTFLQLSQFAIFLPSLYLSLQSFNRGKGKGGILPLRRSYRRPLFDFITPHRKNQPPKKTLITSATIPPAIAVVNQLLTFC